LWCAQRFACGLKKKASSKLAFFGFSDVVGEQQNHHQKRRGDVAK
jgi:hypothetical protein